MAREKMCVGVDIGQSSVKICELRAKKNSYQLVHYASAPLPPEAIIDGALMNAPRIVDTLQELLSAHKVKTKYAAISVSGHSVIVKKIPLPQMTPEELEQSIQWEAEQFIPFDIKDVNVDAQIVNPTSATQGQMDVVLVAAKKEIVNDYTSLLVEAGLEPVVCDVDAFAIENAYEVNYDVPQDASVALINIGATKTNINILSRGTPSFVRDLNIGGNAFTEEIQKQMSVSFEEAEALKIGGSAGQRNPGMDTDIDAVVPQDVERILLQVSETVTSEVQRSIDFYAAASAEASPSQFFLSGGAARLQSLKRALENRMGTTVQFLDPFRRIQVNEDAQARVRSAGPAAAVAVGLALRAVGD